MTQTTANALINKKLEVVGEITSAKVSNPGISAHTASQFLKEIYKAISEAIIENDYSTDDDSGSKARVRNY